MRRKREIWLVRVLLVAFAAILILLPVHTFISNWGGATFGSLLVWKVWPELLMVAMLPFLLAYYHYRPDVAKKLSKNWLTILIAAYIILNIGYGVISHASQAAVIAGLLMNMRFVAILLLAQAIAYSDDTWVVAAKRWLEPWLFVTTILLAVLAILQVTVIPRDFLTQFGYDKQTTTAPYLTVDEHPDALRAFATMRGPNPLGEYLILPLILALLAMIREPRNLLAGLALGLGLVALVATGSRSAWLGLIVAAVALITASVPIKKLLVGIAWAFVPVVSLTFVFFWVAANVPALRLAVFHSSVGDPTLTEGSVDKHWQATTEGAVDVWQHPLGQGVGTAGPASFYNTSAGPKIPENYFVQIAQEMGFVGLGLFVLINFVVVYRLWRQRQQTWSRVLFASFIGLTVVNIFLHGWSDDPTSMTWWGIAGLFLLADNKKVT